MKNREEDRARWQDPDFNKWLDEGISDAGHTVWDSVPDIGSAWNGWDAAKAALDYYCPSCSGSGEEIHTTYHGPDSFERLGNCSTCNGDGRTSAALVVAVGRLEASESMQGLYTSTVTVERAELEQTKRERDQLKAEVDSLTREADRQYTTIEAYRKDAERLNWLDKRAEPVVENQTQSQPEGELAAYRWVVEAPRGNIRDAIDDSISEVSDV